MVQWNEHSNGFGSLLLHSRNTWTRIPLYSHSAVAAADIYLGYLQYSLRYWIVSSAHQGFCVYRATEIMNSMLKFYIHTKLITTIWSAAVLSIDNSVIYIMLKASIKVRMWAEFLRSVRDSGEGIRDSGELVCWKGGGCWVMCMVTNDLVFICFLGDAFVQSNLHPIWTKTQTKYSSEVPHHSLQCSLAIPTQCFVDRRPPHCLS